MAFPCPGSAVGDRGHVRGNRSATPAREAPCADGSNDACLIVKSTRALRLGHVHTRAAKSTPDGVGATGLAVPVTHAVAVVITPGRRHWSALAEATMPMSSHEHPSTAASADTGLPRDPALDNTLSLLNQGYDFISRHCRKLGSDAFETRLMLRPVVCVRGADAAAMFYHPGRFTRRGAMPPTTVSLLQDVGSVQQLDDARHRHRKELFLQVLDPAGTARMVQIFRSQWRSAVDRWSRQPGIELQSEAEQILCRTVCSWAGVPLPEDEVERRTREFTSMIDAAGSFGPSLLTAWLRRRRNERWIGAIIEQLRAEQADPASSPAAAVAAFRDDTGQLLDVPTATVELINLLRPTVAVSRWITFAALALHEHPSLRQRLQAGEPELLLRFVQEVRRYYPFFPLIGGCVREPFDWHGRHFGRGQWVVLDLYGTNHDPALWESPEQFNPDRFAHWDGGAFNFVAQGAGDTAAGHRCPGENPAIALLMVAAGELASALEYSVPPQDLSYPLDRMPALPASGLVMCNVRRVQDAAAEATLH